MESINYSHHEDEHGTAPSLPHHGGPVHGVHHHHGVTHHGQQQVHHTEEEDEEQVDEVDDLGEDLDDEDQDDLSASHLNQDMDGHLGDEEEDPMRRHRKSSVKRRTKSAQQIMILMSHFNRDPKPKKVAIKALVLSTGLTYPEICRWFRNQRLRSKQIPLIASQAAMQHAALQQQVAMQQQVMQQQVMQQQLQQQVAMQQAAMQQAAMHQAMQQHPGMQQLGLTQPMLADDRDMHKVNVQQQIPGLVMPLGMGSSSQVPDHTLLGLNGGPVPTLPGVPTGEAKEEKQWRASSKFRRTRDAFLSILGEFPRGSAERDQLLKDMVRSMGRSDREALQSHLRPRGPYRGSADPGLKMTTKQERAKDVWSEMERRFGAHGRLDDEEGGGQPPAAMTQANGLDVNMMEGLKILFKPHRDYLFSVARELEVTDMLKPEVENELKRKFAVKQARRQELEKQKRDKRKVTPGGVQQVSMVKGGGVMKRMNDMSPPAGGGPSMHVPRMAGGPAYMQHDQHGVPYGAEY